MDLTNVSAAKLSVLRAVNVIEKTTKITILLFLYFFTMVIFLKKNQPSKSATSITDCVSLIFLKQKHPSNKIILVYSSSLNFLQAPMLGFVL